MVFLPVGILQGLISPLTGVITDKVSSKAPIIAGTILFSISFYIFSRLSVHTEQSFIMISLYLRGIAMGMMFTSLSTVSLFDVPREKMAQASGMLNTIRQLGGSLGVAIMATVLSSRINYHVQMFGGAIQSTSVAFQNTVHHLSGFVQYHAGKSPLIAGKLSQHILLSDVNNQAYVEGINDVFLIATIVTLLCLVPVFFLHGNNKKKRLRQNNS